MIVNFIHKYSSKDNCLLNKQGVHQDGGTGACPKKRRKEQNKTNFYR